MRRISVIIPTYNEEAALPRTLQQFEELDGCWDLIVADSSSSDGTVALAKQFDARVIEGAPSGRGDALNAGARHATAQILLFLHADTLLPANAYDLIVNELACPGVAATGFRLRMDRAEWRFRMLSRIATLRFRIQRTFFGDQAIAVRREDFQKIGGYREPLLMEDVELSQRLRKRARLKLLPAYVTTSARRFERGGILRTLLRMSLFQAAYAVGVPAERLHTLYRDVRRDQVNESEPVKRIGLDGLTLLDEDDRPVELQGIAEGQSILLVFLRWLG
jgi:rSAM/selenodomain-associated transferase 2